MEEGPLSAQECREAGNRFVKDGEFGKAEEHYRAALAILDGDEDGGRECSTVLGNLSLVQLKLGQASEALLSAERACLTEPGFAKGYFRQAQALMALTRPSEAANKLRICVHLQGGTALAAQSVEAVMLEASRMAQRLRDDARESGSAMQQVQTVEKYCTAASALDCARDLLVMLCPCLDAWSLARLAATASRYYQNVDLPDLLEARAVDLCPARSRAYLRKDLLRIPGWGASPGWLFARLAESRANVARNRLIVCGADGIGMCKPVLQAETVLQESAECFSMCWSAAGEYFAYAVFERYQAAAATLVLVPHRDDSARSPPRGRVVVPLQKDFLPYYMSPSPCGTRLALLGVLARRQVLIVADTSQVWAPDPERTPPVSLKVLGHGSPLYFDWSPYAPELLMIVGGRSVHRIRADVMLETDPEKALQQSIIQPPTACPGESFARPLFTIRGRLRFRSPQWIEWPGSAEGRWIVPQDHPRGEGRVSLVLMDPAAGTSQTICEHLPPDSCMAVARTGNWAAWTGMHGEHGHGGVIVRRLPPDAGTPIVVFSGVALALSWGGDRLAMLLDAPGAAAEAVWAVWDPPADPCEPAHGRLTVAPRAFIPSQFFFQHILPHFDQFERRMRFWSPSHDAIVYAMTIQDAESVEEDARSCGAKVCVQPFPRCTGRPGRAEVRHPLSHLLGAAEQTETAPAAFVVTPGSLACWSPQ